MGLGQYNGLGEYCGPHIASSVFLILIFASGYECKRNVVYDSLGFIVAKKEHLFKSEYNHIALTL